MPLRLIPTTASRIRRRGPLSLPFRPEFRSRTGPLVFLVLMNAVLGILCGSGSLQARERWTELNIGPFIIDSDGESGAARNDLTQLEQLRWVLGGLLESKD